MFMQAKEDMMSMGELDFDESYLNLLSKPWQKFLKKFTEIDSIPVSEWKHVHQLAHFYRRYNQIFGKRFSFSMKSAPSKCTETYMLKNISGMLGTSNQRILKEYVDWVFDKKVIPSKRKIRSLGYFATASFCNEFNIYLSEKNKIGRHTLLPNEYAKIAEDMNVAAKTFGDLAFAKNAIDAGLDPEFVDEYSRLFNELYKIGFEFNMLKGLK